MFGPGVAGQASLLAEFRYSDLNGGDFQNRFNLANFNPSERQTDNEREYRLGGRVDAAPGVTLVGVWTRGNLPTFSSFAFPFALHPQLDPDNPPDPPPPTPPHPHPPPLTPTL